MRDRTYKNYLLVVLLVILAFNYVDRLAMGLVLQDIKRDFSLSDTQLGLLTGMAFALFYSLMGIPVARWADRGHRVLIIAVTALLGGVLVSLCGAAGTFLQLLIIRVGVAVGEAGCIPTAHSLIADHFTRAERPRAMAVYMLGGPLSVVIGYLLAGWVNELYGWRVTFAVLGVPGVLLSLLVWLTLKEPREQRSRDPQPNPAGLARFPNEYSPNLNEAAPRLSDVCRTLWSNHTFRHLLFYWSVTSFFGYGIAQWQPAFFVRSYGLDTGTLGTWLALIYGLGGVIGTCLGGELAFRLAANRESLQLRTMAGTFSSIGILYACIYSVRNQYLAFALMSVATVVTTMASGPLFATIQTLVPERMRAMSIAVLYLFANLIGMGLGPLLTGAISDVLRPFAGDESLRYALLALCPGYFWGGWHLWRSSKTVAGDMLRTQAMAFASGCAELEPRKNATTTVQQRRQWI